MSPSEAHDPAARIVPIEELFFPDQGPHVVERAPQPPTTASDRLRGELAAHAMQLRGLAERARNAGGDARIVQEAARSLGAAGAALRSFGLHNGAALLGELTVAGDRLDLLQLAGLESAVLLLAQPGDAGRALEAAAQQGLLRRGVYAAVARGLGRAPSTTATRTAAASQPATAASQTATPPHAGVRASRGLAETLDAGISALDALVSRPLSAPVAIPEAAVVPIDSLVYRGPRALQRAMEVRDELRRARTAGAAPDGDALEELFDLLDLAARG